MAPLIVVKIINVVKRTAGEYVSGWARKCHPLHRNDHNGAYVKVCFNEWHSADWDVNRWVVIGICVGGACVVKNCEIGEVTETLIRSTG